MPAAILTGLSCSKKQGTPSVHAHSVSLSSVWVPPRDMRLVRSISPPRPEPVPLVLLEVGQPLRRPRPARSSRPAAVPPAARLFIPREGHRPAEGKGSSDLFMSPRCREARSELRRPEGSRNTRRIRADRPRRAKRTRTAWWANEPNRACPSGRNWVRFALFHPRDASSAPRTLERV